MWRHSIVLGVLIFGRPAYIAQAQEADSPKHYEIEFGSVDLEQAHRSAVAKGLEWIARQQCASCHQDPHGKDVALAGTWLSKQECVRCHFTVPGQGLGANEGSATASGIRSLVTQHNTDPATAETSSTGWLLSQIREGGTALPATCTRNAQGGNKATYLGVGVSPVPELLRRHVKLPADMGLLVETVEVDSPAQAAGVERYDILEKINEQLLVNQEQFSVLIRNYRPGTQITLALIRANQPQTLSATLGEREVAASEVTAGQCTNVFDYDSDGFRDVLVGKLYRHAMIGIDQDGDETLQTINAAGLTPLASARNGGPGAAGDGSGQPERPQVTYLGVQTSSPPAALAGQLKLPEGLFLLVDGVDAGSPAEAAGLRAADVLQQLDNQVLVNSDQLGALIRARKAGEQVTLTLIREGRQMTIRATPGQRDSPLAAQNGDLLTRRADLTSLQKLAEFHNPAIFNLHGQYGIELNDNLYGRYGIELNDPTAGAANDVEFVRRVYLDLVGSAPPPEAVKTFLDDARADKRRRLIDELLSRPDVFDKFKGVSSLEWSDAEHALRLTSEQGGGRRLLAKDLSGKLLFEGPVDADDDRGRLPTAIAAKLALMLQGIDRRGAPPDA
ncbi:MAG TPA: PDZ domain-containing protein, partial [Pirellulales bacterium]|nr:PDZ domain-containing protein [Pirellulales bacterium]